MSLENWNFCGESSNLTELGEFDYKEEYQGYSENFGQNNSSVTRVFIVAYERRVDFLAALLGTNVLTGSIPPDISRDLPDSFILSSAEEPPIFWAIDASVEPLGTPGIIGNRSTWILARIKCVYRCLEYAVLSDTAITGEVQRYITKVVEPVAELISLQGGMYFVNVTPKQALQYSPARLSATCSLSYSWHFIPARSNPYIIPNINNIMNCMGKVNSVAFDGYLPGTVLCVGASGHGPLTRGFDSFYFEETIKFIWKDNGPVTTNPVGPIIEEAGPNFILNIQQGGAWNLVTADGTQPGTRIYGKTDLNNIFLLDGT